MIKYLLYSIGLCMLLSSCEDVKFSKFHHINSKGWNREDTIFFNTDTLRHSGRYGFVCGIRTHRSYPYQELVVMIERKVYNHKRLVLHKLEKATCPIVTPSGTVTGEGIATKLHKTPIRDFYMNIGDSVVVNIYHNMKRTKLPGVTDIGIIMEKK
ncbi:MAG: gliding motility lipoprotein GldH [Prevotella sp.]|nr:gliding motility lipoprotein GldH [Prevotella sp.]